MPSNRRASDFRNIQGDSAIPWNTVTNTSCARRVNQVAGGEGQGSHPARRATQQRGCQPQWIDQGPTGRNYRVSRVVPCYRREWVTTGRDPRPGGRPKQEREQGGGGSKVPAGVQQYGASGSNAWEAGEGRLAGHQEVRTRRTETRSQFFEHRPYGPSISGESAMPESRATRATTSLMTRSCDRVLTIEEGLPAVQVAKRDASRSAW